MFLVQKGGGEGGTRLECGNQCKLALVVVVVLYGIAENENEVLWVLRRGGFLVVEVETHLSVGFGGSKERGKGSDKGRI